MIGKLIRMERILDRNSKRTIIVPMDHGVTVGPIKGIINMGRTVDQVADGGANAVIGHVGLPLHGHRKSGKDIGLILHLSASTIYGPDPNNKVIVNSVQNALKMGADGVSIHINIGAENEAGMLEQLGSVAVECMEWGLPLLAMMYPRGPSIKDPKEVEAVRLAARVAAELGADIVKTVYTGDIKSFRTVVEGCPIPVVIAGGSKGTSEEALGMIHDAIEAGAAGVAMGRNCFQHENPTNFVRAASLIIHKGYGVEKAMKEADLR